MSEPSSRPAGMPAVPAAAANGPSPGPTSGPAGPAPVPPGRRRRVLAVLLLIFALVAAGVGAWHWLVGRWEETTDNAYVGGHMVQVTPQVAGTVTAVLVDDTQRVEAGQLLVQLDPADADVALAQAEAALADAVRSVRALYVGRGQALVAIGQREAEVVRARAELDRLGVDVRRAQADYDRRRGLLADEAVSAEEVEHARQALEAARSALAAAQAAREAAAAGVKQAREQLAAADVPIDRVTIERHPRVLQAAARVREAWLARARTRIVAPIAGYVVRRSVQLGQRLAPGAPLLTVVPLDQVWVDANFKESQLATLRIGQPVRLTADAWDGVRYEGRITGLGVGTGGTLSILPAQNATGNWIKIVQRVPVRIALQPDQLRAHPLRLGLSMRVQVDVHAQDGAVLPAAPAEAAAAPTATIPDEGAAQADALIAKIIAEHRG